MNRRSTQCLADRGRCAAWLRCCSPPAPATSGRRHAPSCVRWPATTACAAGCCCNGACRACSRRRWSARCWACAGAVFQGVFRNPLAEPYLLGARAARRSARRSRCWCRWACRRRIVLPVLAFAGAWGATVLVIGVSRVAGALDAAGMLLAGVAIAAMLGALRSFLMLGAVRRDREPAGRDELGARRHPDAVVARPRAAGRAVAWRACWPRCASRTGSTCWGSAGARRRASGSTWRASSPRAVIVGSVVVAAAVAFGGLVAFVGLAAPHIARWMVGPLHQALLPASALIGRHRRRRWLTRSRARRCRRRRFRWGWSRPLRAAPSSSCCWREGCGHERHIAAAARSPRAGRIAPRPTHPARRVDRLRAPPALSPSSVPTAPASRRCSRCWPASRSRRRARCGSARVRWPTCLRPSARNRSASCRSTSSRIGTWCWKELAGHAASRRHAGRPAGTGPTVDDVIARHQLDAFRGRRWSTLSGGEQGACARDRAGDHPPILLADEPGAALDVRHRLTLVEALGAERGRTRLVIVASARPRHWPSATSTRIVVVADGRIAIDGGPELIHSTLPRRREASAWCSTASTCRRA